MIQSLIQYHDISKVIWLVVDNLRNGVLDLVQRYRFQIVFFFYFFYFISLVGENPFFSIYVECRCAASAE